MTSPVACAINDCDFNGTQWVMYVWAEVFWPVWDDSIFPPATIALTETMDDVDAGNATIDDLLDVIKSVFGWISCDGLNSSEIDFFDLVHTTEFFRTNTCTYVALARLHNVQHVPGPSSVRIQIRARPFGPWWQPAKNIMHSSIHHPDLGFDWYTGVAENQSGAAVNNGGNLIKKVSYPADRRQNAFLVGLVDGPILVLPAWLTVTAGFNGYDNDLRYCFWPEVMEFAPPPMSCNGYNSNSFVRGLADLTGGSIVWLPHAATRPGGP